MAGIAKTLRRFDAYRQVHAELTEGTPYGGVISLISLATIAFLVCSEGSRFMQVDLESRMFVDISRDEKLAIHLNVSFPNLACGVAALDKQDAMGLHEMDVGEHNPGEGDKKGGEDGGGGGGEGNDGGKEAGGGTPRPQGDASGVPAQWETGVTKLRLSKAGARLAKEVPPGASGFVETYRQIEDGEGCMIYGTLEVNKVPGNVHISAHTRKPGINLYRLNVAHTVHHLSFGDMADGALDAHSAATANANAAVPEAVGALNGKTYTMGEGETIRYYTKVVPTTLVALDGRKTYSHQYTANANVYRSDQQMAAVWLQYELSPITVELSERRQPLSHFVVSICAVVGGVFTVMGLVDGLVHQTYVNVLQKIQLGKAS